jgi:hypothetical protein
MLTPVTKTRARRIAIRAQQLAGDASSVAECVSKLGFLQLDPTGVVPAQHFVLWSRLKSYRPADLDKLLWETKELFQWRAYVWSAEALPALRSTMRHFTRRTDGWAHAVTSWLSANKRFRRYVLTELRANGPMVSRELEDRAEVPWASSGWTGNRNVTQMLEFLNRTGDVAIVGQRGKLRLWDIAERWYPPVEPMPLADAEAWLSELRARAAGVSYRDGKWFAARDADDRPIRRTTLLSPFDRLIHDRKRTQDLFDFEYTMEIYVPKDRRKYGYFVLPVLHRDRLVGRVDPSFDRRTRTLRINRMFWETQPVSIREPVTSLAEYLGATSVIWPEKDAMHAADVCRSQQTL